MPLQRAQRALSHRQAIALMVLCTLLWSMAGVITRHLDATQGVEVNVWRSLFNALAIAALLLFSKNYSNQQQDKHYAALSRAMSWPLWLSSLLWAAMFTSFMLALTMTTVSNVLIMSSLSPLITALVARIFFRQRIALVTWLAIACAVAGMVWMFLDSILSVQNNALSQVSIVGMLVALIVPLSAALNFTVVHRCGHAINLVPAVGLGGLWSALLTLPFAWPLQTSLHDVIWLAVLGVFQLAIPCVLLVLAMRVLSATEIALLSLLEVIFGTVWTWWGANETPTQATLMGGAVVLIGLVMNALAAPRNIANSATNSVTSSKSNSDANLALNASRPNTQATEVNQS